MPRSTRNPYAPPPAGGKEKVAEDLLQQRLMRRCKELDLYAVHLPKTRMRDGSWRTVYRGDGKGKPDTEILGTELLYAELKVGNNDLTVEQREWTQRLRFAKVGFVVWTEQHWDTGLIEETLCRLAGGVPCGYCIDRHTPSREFGPDMVVSSGLAARLARGGAA